MFLASSLSLCMCFRTSWIRWVEDIPIQLLLPYYSRPVHNYRSTKQLADSHYIVLVLVAVYF